MRRLLVGGVLLLTACGGILPLQAQKARSFDHIHFSVPDPEAAQAWYMTHLGGVLGESPDRVTFGGMPWKGEPPLPVQLLWQRSAADAPAAVGGAIDNLGFSFADLDAKVRQLEAAGIAIESPVQQVPGLWRRAVIRDPWGVKIELVEDAALLGFHHVELRVPDPATTLAWYVDRFGGERTKLHGRLDAVSYGNVYLVATAGPAIAATPGYGVNHIGWAAHSIDDLAAQLRAAGVHFTSEPSESLNRYGHRIAFVQGPDGVRIEIVEHIECAFRPGG